MDGKGIQKKNEEMEGENEKDYKQLNNFRNLKVHTENFLKERGGGDNVYKQEKLMITRIIFRAKTRADG